MTARDRTGSPNITGIENDHAKGLNGRWFKGTYLPFISGLKLPSGIHTASPAKLQESDPMAVPAEQAISRQAYEANSVA